jgi:acyl-CoA-binding protein
LIVLDDDEAKLMFYAFGQQATVGKNSEPAPGMFSIDFASKAKWSAWDQVGMLGSMEAMSYFVRSLEKIDATWNEKLQLLSAAAAAAQEEVRLYCASTQSARLLSKATRGVALAHIRTRAHILLLIYLPGHRSRARKHRGRTCSAPSSAG